MQHLDVAGGTGDVAFRVLRAIRNAELVQQQQQDYTAPQQRQGLGSQRQLQQHQLEEEQQQGHVTVFDINQEMLNVGQQRAQQQGDCKTHLQGLCLPKGDVGSVKCHLVAVALVAHCSLRDMCPDDCTAAHLTGCSYRSA